MRKLYTAFKGDSFMNNILIGICESSDSDKELLIQYLRLIEVSFGMNFDIHIYSNGKDLLNNFRPVYDIFFITLPSQDIDAETLISSIRQKDSLAHIILLSESLDFFRLGFEYNVANYFNKPLWYFKILNELKKYLSDEQILKRSYLWLSTQQGEYKLYLHKLRFIETGNRQLELHYGSELFFYNGKLSDFDNQLTGKNFFRCNNSYIVNINYIEKIEKDINRYLIHLVTGEKIPLSRNKKKELKELLFFHTTECK